MQPPGQLLIFVSTGAPNTERRRACRRSWFQYLRADDSPLTPEAKASVSVVFIAAKGDEALEAEAVEEGDIVLLDAPEGYANLWRKALVFLRSLVDARHGEGEGAFTHVMHADDDSFVRLDLLLPLMASWPRARFYWGYIWDGTSVARTTAPVRDPANKSHMPPEQYPSDFYPPFASGCGFVLSWDLVVALTRQQLPDYRLLDPPFGIHLCGAPSDGFLVLDEPIVPVHDERVRPYRPLPTFRPDTLVQHYLRAEEMRPFYCQARGGAAAAAAAAAAAGSDGGGAAAAAAGTDAAAGGAAAAAEAAEGAAAAGSGGGAAPGGTCRADAAGVGAVGEGAVEAGAPEQLYNTLVGMGLLRR
ncbi:hypothetical protein FOA52_007902 [Chlamydomonas sp. UWO 241]|nr:hypothetical protein FOA52_007902 [Chlamydomonas sp. UWO 241]